MKLPFLSSARCPSPPTWLAKRAARRQVTNAAREYAYSHTTGTGATSSGVGVVVEVPFRQRIQAFVGTWLADIAKWCRPLMEANYIELARLVPILERQYRTMRETRNKVPTDTRLAAFDSLWVVLLAEIVAVASLYELVADLPLPIALLACVAIGGIEAALGITFGMATGALALSGHHPTFRLAPRERRWWKSMAVGSALVLVPLVVLLGAMRGDGLVTLLLWIVLGLAMCALLAAYGAAHYESRPARRARDAENEYQDTANQAHALMRINETGAEQAVAHAVRAIAQGHALNDDAYRAFVEEWSALRHDKPTPPPLLVTMALPTSEEIQRMMVVSFPRNLHDDLVHCGLTLVHRIVWLDAAEQPRTLTPASSPAPLPPLLPTPSTPIEA